MKIQFIAELNLGPDEKVKEYFANSSNEKLSEVIFVPLYKDMGIEQFDIMNIKIFEIKEDAESVSKPDEEVVVVEENV